MPESLKTRITRGDRVVVFAVSRVFHPNMIQMFGIHGGFDGFWIDHEHAGLTVEQMELAAMAGRTSGLDSFVRVAPTDYALVTRCLESGASGVMAAQINTAEQAEEFVQWSKFAPRGRRGLNAGGFDGRFGNVSVAEFCERANRETFVAIQIETADAVENCEAIAAIDGVDLLFVGPSDLSQALGVTGDFMHARCVEAIDRVAAACRDAGIHWGAVTTTADHARMLSEKGCTMLSPTNDVRMVNAGIKAVKGQFDFLFEG
ncbi:5-keto-4-deoxy-D-glucarate aldolase [Maioricimonas rarisocia]|uniref:5-keto-4-deoxy-D-glucarate aldolase n=1 Tax=Maioricimonas rarisocia TaxID=2528026 RepID=A0A517Z4D1_9PLAN|nr:aldolase/citrate lyase family protein [Maioricimonas rarisocia]QDU37341.1 5-keto-4-deoxy-D-glucarate aldolase [Maioricimonas rarisocia]